VFLRQPFVLNHFLGSFGNLVFSMALGGGGGRLRCPKMGLGSFGRTRFGTGWASGFVADGREWGPSAAPR
jgi:hypothetical protein